MKYSFKEMNSFLDQHDFKFKKKFGQNFIVDENIINKLVNDVDIDKDTLVLEIGPGAGSLTVKLAEVAKNVLCYEIDDSLNELLSFNLKQFNNVDIIYGDFLKQDVLNDIKKYEYKKLYVVANLPYYITTPIIVKIIEDDLNIDKIVVMVQKEVGDRFNAKIKTKNYGSLTVYLNYFFNIRKVMNVSRNVFLPKPNVDSIIVEFSKKEALLDLKDKDLFFKIVRDSFKQKRKTIKNNLSMYDLDKISAVLAKNNLSLSSRAEEMELSVFVDIANELAN